MKALILAARERLHQIEEEGWSLAHDDTHVDGELAAAGAAYAASAEDQARGGKSALDDMPPAFWPWDDAWWKPADPRRNLVKAIALLVAEYERLERRDTRGDGVEPCWSLNGEDFHDAVSLEEFIGDREVEDGALISAGIKRTARADDYTEGAAEVVAEHMEVQAYDHAGDLADGWDVKGDAVLQALIDAWAQTIDPPNYFTVEAVTEHRVRITAEGVDLVPVGAMG